MRYGSRHLVLALAVIAGPLCAAAQDSTAATSSADALDGVQWALNAGAGLRFKLGPIGGGLEVRFREIPVDGAKTFFSNVTAIPVTFSLIF